MLTTPHQSTGAQPRHSCPRTSRACAPNAATCFTCNLALSRCACPYPGDDDMMPAVDVCRIMDLLSPDSGWGFAERCALGMGKK